MSGINTGMFDVWTYGVLIGGDQHLYHLFILDNHTSKLLFSADLVNYENMSVIVRALEENRTGETVAEGYDTFSPEDIYDLANAGLIVGQNSYPILDKNNLGELAKTLANAKRIKSSGCPFDAVLKLTRADGKTETIVIASDSCAVYKSADVYYDYSDGDNSRLLSLFGINADTLFNTLYQ